MEEEKSIIGPVGRTMLVFLSVLAIFTLGAVSGVMMADENPNCPDCNLECPDVTVPDPDITYYPPNITVDFDDQAILEAIWNSELNISDKMALYTSWLFGNTNYTNLIIWDIKDGMDASIIFRMPEDYVDIEYYEPNVSVLVGYYNNTAKAYELTPVIPLDNWTWLVGWIMQTVSYDYNILTNLQTLQMAMISLDMAYYKETGTWLGE